MIRRIFFCLLLLGLTAFGAQPVQAGETLTVAVAANFMTPFQEMARLYQEKTGVEVNGVFTSTGNLFAQIRNGAPYDLFLAADETRPARLAGEDLCYKPFVYATGRLILWSANRDLCEAATWQDALQRTWVEKLAIANPETAPYGAAAVAVLEDSGLWERLKPKMVRAQNIAQVFQYAHTGAVDAGFCALSSAFTEEGEKGCFHRIEEAPVIVQAACVLKRTCILPRVEDFVRFLQSEEAEAVKSKYGYN